jgi:hypothetical protein
MKSKKFKVKRKPGMGGSGLRQGIRSRFLASQSESHSGRVLSNFHFSF